MLAKSLKPDGQLVVLDFLAQDVPTSGHAHAHNHSHGHEHGHEHRHGGNQASEHSKGQTGEHTIAHKHGKRFWLALHSLSLILHEQASLQKN